MEKALQEDVGDSYQVVVLLRFIERVAAVAVCPLTLENKTNPNTRIIFCDSFPVYGPPVFLPFPPSLPSSLRNIPSYPPVCFPASQCSTLGSPSLFSSPEWQARSLSPRATQKQIHCMRISYVQQLSNPDRARRRRRRAPAARPDLAVGAEVGRWDLQRDLVIRQRVHLLGQKVGFSHQSVGFHNLLPEPGEALTEELVPAATQARTDRQTPSALPLSASAHSFQYFRSFCDKGCNDLSIMTEDCIIFAPC